MSYCHTGSVLIYDFIPMRPYGIIKLAVDFCRSRSFLNEGEVNKWNYFNSLILDRVSHIYCYFLPLFTT